MRDIFAPGIRHKTILGTCLAGMALVGTWASIQWVTPWANKLAAGTDSADDGPVDDANQPGDRRDHRHAGGRLFAEWFSRRKSYFVLCLASLLVCAYLFRSPLHFRVTAAWFDASIRTRFFGGVRAFDSQFVFVAGLAGGVTASFYGWLPLYLPELFPTRIRATGQGFAFNFGRMLAAVGALQGGQLLDYFQEDYARMCGIMSLVYLVGMVLIWFCPETKGQPLPE